MQNVFSTYCRIKVKSKTSSKSGMGYIGSVIHPDAKLSINNLRKPYKLSVSYIQHGMGIE
jgi:hypothetical protein